VANLRKAEERSKEKRFLIEGRREVSRALENGFIPEMLFFREDIPQESWFNVSSQYFSVTKEVFEKISGRENPDGILAVASMKNLSLPTQVPKDAIILLLEQLEKPGNLGAILRTAESIACSLVILTNPLSDIWNPNVIRASQGAIFSLTLAITTNEEALNFLQRHHIPIVATTPRAEITYWDHLKESPIALAAGNEHFGLSDFWMEHSHIKVSIPMFGQTSDSLNVGIATALCLYEIRRCRKI
jgi:TrmH family RNA methyltransferase